MHCCCWVIGPHTVDVGFHIHVGDKYYVFNYSDDYSWWLWCSVGIRGDDLGGDLVPHVSRVGLGTLHGVNYTFVVDVCFVIICDRWNIYLLKIVGDNLVNIWRCIYCWCLWNMKYLDDWLFLFIRLIMIDVKLTTCGLWWTAYLFVWMGRRHGGLVDLLAWWVAWG